MGRTIISWATHTVNVVSGCSHAAKHEDGTGCAPECAHCYAEALSLRRHWSEKPWVPDNAAENVRLRPERIREIRKIPVLSEKLPPSQRHRLFICSMGDTFHDQVPDSFIHQLWETMVMTPHIYQMLTKRPERAKTWPGPWPEHIWLGTSCGHDDSLWRVDHLRQSPAKVRFISAEPLLSPLKKLNLEGIHQLIVGGESGAGFRKMEMAWCRYLRDKCKETKTAFFYKQDSAYVTETRPWLVEEDGRRVYYREFPGELSGPVPVSAADVLQSKLEVVG